MFSQWNLLHTLHSLFICSFYVIDFLIDNNFVSEVHLNIIEEKIREFNQTAVSTLYPSVDAVQEGIFTVHPPAQTRTKRNNMPELAGF